MTKQAPKPVHRDVNAVTETVEAHAKKLDYTQLGTDLLDVISDHSGVIRYSHFSPNGKPRLMSVRFGPRTFPTLSLEIRDYGNEEDPLERDKRTRANREAAKDRRYRETQAVLKEALAQQRQELAEEWGIMEKDPTAPKRPAGHQVQEGERWSKKSFTGHLAACLGLGDRELDSIDREGSNVLLIQDGDQTFKITVSMPRQKKN